jgi:FAD/FMN-containing dehydrogenase
MIDCVAFSLLHPEAVFLRDTAEYSKSANNYFAAFENEVDPMCIVRPRSAGELRKIVKYLSTISPLPQVAIKGGGHTAWAGAANIQDGVLIDMINFDEITVNHNTKTVSIGAGQRWGNVYKQLVPLGLGMHDGRVSKVGVSGLILGGSYSPSCDA